MTSLVPGASVDTGDVAVDVCPPDDGLLAVAVQATGVAVLFTPDAALTPDGESRDAQHAADTLVDEPTRFHGHRRLHGAVNVIGVPPKPARAD